MKLSFFINSVIVLSLFTSCKEKTMPYHLPYGAYFNGQATEFTIYAPTSTKVFLVIFESYDATTGREYSMAKNALGDWSITLKGAGFGTYYGYRLEGPQNDPTVIVADPWTQAAITQNSYRHVAKSMVVDTRYDWGDDHWLAINPRDLIIYEMHVRDMTVHPTSGSSHPGTYTGLVDKNQTGGIVHLKNMGVNAVQILPCQDYANVEIPYKDDSAPVYNSWNPYARNHWGYMTTFFFAPETYYGTDGTMKPGAWNGIDGRAVSEFKDMVRSLHKEKIAVIMDVVYNHVSHYDWNPLKYIDKKSYFRLTDDGDFIAQSGCGNDCQTENPAMRDLIIESVKYWMSEYHVDGFRFDLGNLIDPETRERIISELRMINPDVIIIAEPWGGGYDPAGFSDQGWASFNDQIRNGIKGENPLDGLGFIFGQSYNGNDAAVLQRFAMGSLRKFGGQYISAAHSVNYLESHDDYTFGDFIRLATRKAFADQPVKDHNRNSKTDGRQLALNKLGAMALLTNQGIAFIHEGQEWSRSKVIAKTELADIQVGCLDHNSYNKDDQTNWINWTERDMNSDLVDYYRGLIHLRRQHPELRRSTPRDFEFFDTKSKIALAYMLQNKLIVAMNGNPQTGLSLVLPKGTWRVIANSEKADIVDGLQIFDSITVSPVSGIILRRES